MIGETWVLGWKFYYETDSIDSENKAGDLIIIREVVDDDAYNLRAFKANNPDAKNFLDIGANIGVFTRFAKHLFPDAKVVCAEPLYQNFELLRKNTSELSNIELINKAVIGTDDIEIGFEAPALVTGRNGMKSSGDGYVDRTKGPKVHACKIQRLLKDLEQVDFLKIDCEGSEAEIFESMNEDELKRLKHIAGEWHWNEERVSKALAKTHSIISQKKDGYNIGYFEATRL